MTLLEPWPLKLILDHVVLDRPLPSSLAPALTWAGDSPVRVLYVLVGASPDRFGLIHCDFLAENLLVDGERITLLDFDDAGYGWHLFDMATALAMATLRDDFDDLRAAFLSGYRRQRVLSDEHLARLPLFLALRAATYVAWIQTRSHTQFAKDLGGIVRRAAVDTTRRYLKT